jgi:AcrR family transcriptional regulator
MSIRYRMVAKKEALKLTRQDWIDRGLKLLADKGVDSVRVEPLAKLMNVTKGSFYWHFKQREDLLAAILQEWIALETTNIIDRVDRLHGDAKTKLLYLFELAIEDDGRVETAIRAWAVNDVKIANDLARIDRLRLAYTRDLFVEAGFAPFEAMVRAHTIYYALIGAATVGMTTDLAERLTEVRLQHAILTRL